MNKNNYPGAKNIACSREKKMQIKRMIVVFSLILFMGISTQTIQASEKVVIGEVEKVTLLPWGVTLSARIDTGACLSSIDVRDFVVRRKKVKFKLSDRAGGMELELPLLGWRRVKSAETAGRRRPVVEMEVCLGTKKLKTPVTLNNRAQMEYPMLVGVPVLAGNFLVDVSQANIHPAGCSPERMP